MTEQYYSQEDEPDMSNPDVAIDLIHQEAAALAPYPAEAAQAFNEIIATLTPWIDYAQANNDSDLMNKCATIYSRAEQMFDQVKHMDAHGAAAAAVLKTINEFRVKASLELEELTEAIDSYDTRHPKLEDFVEQIEQDAYEMASEEVYYDNQVAVMEEASELADEVMYDRCYNTLYNLLHRHGIDYQAIGELRSAILEEDDESGVWTPERRELLFALARTFEPHLAPVDLDGPPEV